MGKCTVQIYDIGKYMIYERNYHMMCFKRLQVSKRKDIFLVKRFCYRSFDCGR